MNKTQNVEFVKNYLVQAEKPPVFNTLIRGYLELTTIEIRILLEALVAYKPSTTDKEETQDKLLEMFCPAINNEIGF